MADNTSKRGLAYADESTRKKVAKKGGESSHGGDRKSESQSSDSE
jgi:hypothetical protein